MRNCMRIIIAAALIFSCCASAFALGDLPSIDAYVDVPAEADGGSVFVATYDANGAFTGIKTGDAGSFPTSAGGESIITVDDCANPGSVKAFFLTNEGLSPVSASGLPSRLDAYATVDLTGGTYGVVTIPETVGNGSIQLTDVTITEALNVLGGGSHSVTLIRCSLPKIVANKEQDVPAKETPRIVLQETDVPLIQAEEPVIIEAVGEATVEQVSAAADVEIRGEDVTVNQIVVTEEAPANVQIDAGTQDVEVVVNSDKGVSVTGENVTISTDLNEEPEVELNGQTVAHVHSWDTGTVTTEPGRNREGVKTFHCSGCDETKTEILPALDYDPLEEGMPYFKIGRNSPSVYFVPANLTLDPASIDYGTANYVTMADYIDTVEFYIGDDLINTATGSNVRYNKNGQYYFFVPVAYLPKQEAEGMRLFISYKDGSGLEGEIINNPGFVYAIGTLDRTIPATVTTVYDPSVADNKLFLSGVDEITNGSYRMFLEQPNGGINTNLVFNWDSKTSQYYCQFLASNWADYYNGGIGVLTAYELTVEGNSLTYSCTKGGELNLPVGEAPAVSGSISMSTENGRLVVSTDSPTEGMIFKGFCYNPDLIGLGDSILAVGFTDTNRLTTANNYVTNSDSRSMGLIADAAVAGRIARNGVNYMYGAFYESSDNYGVITSPTLEIRVHTTVADGVLSTGGYSLDYPAKPGHLYAIRAWNAASTYPNSVSFNIRNGSFQIGTSVADTDRWLIDWDGTAISAGNGVYDVYVILTRITDDNTVNFTYDEATDTLTFTDTAVILSGGLCDGVSYFTYSDTAKHLVISDDTEIIGDGAFCGFSVLQDVSFGNNIAAIGASAFESCSSLESVVIPNSVVALGNYAFNDCGKLSSVTLGSGLTVIGGAALFENTAITTIALPDSISDIGIAFNYASELRSFTVSATNPYFTVVDGVLYSRDGKKLVFYPNGKDQASFTVPDGTETIGRQAFYGCRKLVNVTIPTSVTSLEANCLTVVGLNTINYTGTEAEWDAIEKYYSYLDTVTINFNVCVNHTFGDWSVVTDPTYEKDGKSVRTCQVCGAEEYRIDPKLGFELVPGAVTLAADDMTGMPVVCWTVPADGVPGNATCIILDTDNDPSNGYVYKIDYNAATSAVLSASDLAGQICEGDIVVIYADRSDRVLGGYCSDATISLTTAASSDTLDLVRFEYADGSVGITVTGLTTGRAKSIKAGTQMFSLPAAADTFSTNFTDKNAVSATLSVVEYTAAYGSDGKSLTYSIAAPVELATSRSDSELLSAAEAAGIIRWYNEEPDPADYNKPLTRMGAVELMCGYLNLPAIPLVKSLNFTDCGDLTDAQRGMIRFVCDAGIVQGYSDGTFGPNTVLTRAQLVQLIGRMAELSAAPANAQTLVDVPATAWYASVVNQAYGLGIVSASNGYFFPNAPASKYDAVEWMYAALQYKPSTNVSNIRLENINGTYYVAWDNPARDLGYAGFSISLPDLYQSWTSSDWTSDLTRIPLSQLASWIPTSNTAEEWVFVMENASDNDIAKVPFPAPVLNKFVSDDAAPTATATNDGIVLSGLTPNASYVFEQYGAGGAITKSIVAGANGTALISKTELPGLNNNAGSNFNIAYFNVIVTEELWTIESGTSYSVNITEPMAGYTIDLTLPQGTQIMDIIGVMPDGSEYYAPVPAAGSNTVQIPARSTSVRFIAAEEGAAAAAMAGNAYMAEADLSTVTNSAIHVSANQWTRVWELSFSADPGLINGQRWYSLWVTTLNGFTFPTPTAPDTGEVFVGWYRYGSVIAADPATFTLPDDFWYVDFQGRWTDPTLSADAQKLDDEIFKYETYISVRAAELATLDESFADFIARALKTGAVRDSSVSVSFSAAPSQNYSPNGLFSLNFDMTNQRVSSNGNAFGGSQSYNVTAVFTSGSETRTLNLWANVFEPQYQYSVSVAPPAALSANGWFNSCTVEYSDGREPDLYADLSTNMLLPESATSITFIYSDIDMDAGGAAAAAAGAPFQYRCTVDLTTLEESSIVVGANDWTKYIHVFFDTYPGTIDGVMGLSGFYAVGSRLTFPVCDAIATGDVVEGWYVYESVEQVDTSNYIVPDTGSLDFQAKWTNPNWNADKKKVEDEYFRYNTRIDILYSELPTINESFTAFMARALKSGAVHDSNVTVSFDAAVSQNMSENDQFSLDFDIDSQTVAFNHNGFGGNQYYSLTATFTSGTETRTLDISLRVWAPTKRYEISLTPPAALTENGSFRCFVVCYSDRISTTDTYYPNMIPVGTTATSVYFEYSDIILDDPDRPEGYALNYRATVDLANVTGNTIVVGADDWESYEPQSVPAAGGGAAAGQP